MTGPSASASLRAAAEKTARIMKTDRKRILDPEAVSENPLMSAFNHPQDEIAVQWSRSLQGSRSTDFFQENLSRKR
jgi:hypothetical protein